MDISVAFRTLVIDRANNGGIPPPVIMELSGMVSFEYKWLIPCTPQVTKVIWQRGSLIKQRKQIEHLVGNLEVDFSVKLCEASSMPLAILTINDCDGILRQIFSVLGEASNGFYVEVRYLEQILTFTGFNFLTYQGYEDLSVPFNITSNPCPQISPFQAMLLKLDTIELNDFKVSIILSYGGENEFEDDKEEESVEDDDQDDNVDDYGYNDVRDEVMWRLGGLRFW